MNENRQTMLKWLRILFYVQLAGVLLSHLDLLLPIGVTWARRIVNLAAVVCLFLLPRRYRGCAIFKAAGLVCSLICLALPNFLPLLGTEGYLLANSVLSWAGRILSFIALFLEYNAHAAVAPQDARKWNILFVCAAALFLVSSAAVILLQDTLNEMTQNGITWDISLYNLTAQLLGLAVSIAYLVLLYRTIQAVRSEEFTNG